ncbi:hypothetical protein IHE45_14G063600 [Dioscorea alata]|uniref:Uncharacterized protein n=2 Tax=Dioscorea alata TaxID=55571 RepID=A0ACB7USA6_DIOAL|nr:hypothetical protein IHE45_14G063600 [Dioscorea alata]KAH7663557.1 hypothetical protein IHE45_14G063600 [Dioscorea alata]
MSFSHDLPDDFKNPEKPSPVPETSDLEESLKDIVDFEFLLHDPVAMLPADELFSDEPDPGLSQSPSPAVPSQSPSNWRSNLDNQVKTYKDVSVQIWTICTIKSPI